MTNDERISYLEELVQTAYNGYSEYKPFFDKLNDAYLLVLENEQYNSLKERNKSKNYIPKLNVIQHINRTKEDIRRPNRNIF